jgi:Flp pilus assembly protein TadD
MRWIIVAVIAAAILAYLPAFSAPFVMDDVVIVGATKAAQTAGSSLLSFTPPPGSPISGRPVVALSLAANRAINSILRVDERRDPDGVNKAVSYRLFNLFFHLCTAALLFGVLRRAIREETIPADWRPLADSIAGMVCTLWVLHPIQSEVINYVVQRTEGLASLFYLLTMYCSLRAWDSEKNSARIGWYVAAVLAAVLGVGSKEIAISVPLAVILYDRAFRFNSWSEIRNAPNGRSRFYVALTAATLTAFALISAGSRGGTVGFNLGMPWYGYFYTQCWAIAHYLMLVLWPNGFNIDYGTGLITGLRGVPGALLLAAFGAVVIRAWRRLPQLGWLAFLGAWFFMLLAPSSSVLPIPTEIAAERRIYLALASVLVLMVVGVEWSRRQYVKAMTTRQLWMGFGALATVLTLTTANRSHTYSTSELLWRDAVAQAPENPRAWDNLGMALFREGPSHYEESSVAFRAAMQRDSSCHFGCAHLAVVEAAQGRYAEALALLQHTLTDDPSNAPVERTMALVLMKMGKFDEAIPHLRNVATQFPTEQHLVLLGVADLSVRRQQDAISAFSTAERLYPQDTKLTNLGASLYYAGRSDDALPHLKELAISLAEEMQ